MAPRASTTAAHESDPGELFAAGTMLYECGAAADTVFVIQQGEVELLHGDAEKIRLLARLGAGEPCGAVEVLLGTSYGARARTASDVRALRIDGATFREMCLERPDIAIRFAEALAGQVGRLEGRLAVLGMNDLVRPLARALLRLADRCEDGLRVATPLRGIAAGAGLSLRETHQALQQLFEDKRVRLVDETLFIPDEASLTAYLNDGPLTG